MTGGGGEDPDPPDISDGEIVKRRGRSKNKIITKKVATKIHLSPAVSKKLESININPNMFNPIETLAQGNEIPCTPMTCESEPCPTMSQPSQPTDKIHTNDNINKNRYELTDSAPFVVNISSIDRNIGNLHPISIGKKIINKYPNFKTDIINISVLNKSTIKLELKSAKTANFLVTNNPFVEDNYNVYIPTHLVERQGVIQNVDPDITENELLQEIESKIPILKIKRIMRKSSDQLIPTYSVIIHFKGQVLPQYVSTYCVRFPVKPYVYKVTQCFSCLRYGHTAKYCKYPSRCNRCTGEHNSRDCEVTANPICINCKGSHIATDHKNCPIYAEQAKIKTYMANNNVSFTEARKHIQKSYANVAQKNNINNFNSSNISNTNSNNNIHTQVSNNNSEPQITPRFQHFSNQNQIRNQSTTNYQTNTENSHPRGQNQTVVTNDPINIPINPIGSNPYPPLYHNIHNNNKNLVELISQIVTTFLNNIFKEPISSIPDKEDLKISIEKMLTEGHYIGQHNG